MGITTMRALRGRVRPLLIFAPEPTDPELEIQIRTLKEHEGEAHDREIVAIALPYHNPSPSEVQLSTTETANLRRLYHVAPDDFAVLLVGKDGGVKLRSKHPLSMRTLDQTIDAMPMRQDEVNARGHNH